MPRRNSWALLQFQIPDAEVDAVREAMKAHTSWASNLVACTVCATAEPHTMRYRIFKCSSPSCASASFPSRACPWQLKTVACHSRHVTSMYTMGEHVVLGDDPPSGKLTQSQKNIARSLTAHGLTPLRIQNAIAAETQGVAVPLLRTLQNFVAYYRKKRMNNTDDIPSLIEQISTASYRGDEEEGQAFAFSSDLDASGVPVVGDGSDETPFAIGYTSKLLLMRMDRPPESFVFHLDATYKTSQVDYPLFVFGVSDAARSFHLVALFVTSQQQETHITHMLTSIRHIYGRVVGKPLVLRYVMGDGDGTQFNAVKSVFDDCAPEYLMCFFHVVTKIYENKKGASNAKIALAVADIYDMHFAKSAAQFQSVKTAAIARWMNDPDVLDFGAYFCQQWLPGKFTKWQCFRTPIGFATTNNPVEQLNNKLKTVYTIRTRMKMGMLLNKLAQCCESEGRAQTPFHGSALLRPKLNVRADELRRKKYIVEVPSLDNGGEEGADDFVMVMSKQTPIVNVRKLKKTVEVIEVRAQMGINTARMKRDEQPAAGWAVDITKRACPCKYFFKYGKCVHLLLACYVRFGTNDPGAMVPMLVNRSKKRTLEEQIVAAVASKRATGGRPILNGPAWSLV